MLVHSVCVSRWFPKGLIVIITHGKSLPNLGINALQVNFTFWKAFQHRHNLPSTIHYDARVGKREKTDELVHVSLQNLVEAVLQGRATSCVDPTSSYKLNTNLLPESCSILIGTSGGVGRGMHIRSLKFGMMPFERRAVVINFSSPFRMIIVSMSTFNVWKQDWTTRRTETI